MTPEIGTGSARVRRGGRRPTGAGGVLLESAAAIALQRRDLGEDGIDVLALLQQHRPPVREHHQEFFELRALVARRSIEIQQFADLGQREAEALASHDQLYPYALALGVHPGTA